MDGSEFDLDATVDYLTDQFSNHTPTEKKFLSSRKKGKDISILLLLDLSLSSDGYVDGLKILDIEKQVTILFSEILDEYNIPFSIHAFYSKTRNHTR